MKNEPMPATMPSDNQVSPSTFRPACEFRWCYYLHLNTAKKSPSNKQWYERDGHPHPVFEVEGKKRPVFVRGYFHDEQFHGERYCLIYPVTTKDKLGNKKKPNLKRLGVVLPGETCESFVQTISERYPLALIEQAGKEPPYKPDPMTSNAICRVVDSITYRSSAVS